jgi:hypothetical protein
MTKKKTPSKPKAAAKQETGGGCPEATCSRLAWRTYENRAILGYSRKMPDVTLFVIEFLPLDETRGTLSGAFIPDAAETKHACKRAPIQFLKGMAEGFFHDFMEIHSANA